MAKTSTGNKLRQSGGDPDVLTRRQLADRLGVHMQTVTGWEQQGMPIETRGRRGKPSLYSLTRVRAWRVERDAMASAAPSPANELAAARANREKWQAALAQQQHEVRQRQLLSADEVARLWAAEVAAVRTLILTSYSTHADRVHRAATLDGVKGAERVLKELAHEILRELASPDRAPAPSPAEGAA